MDDSPVLALVALVCFVALTAFAVMSRRRRHKIAASANWPSVRGVVLSSRVETRRFGLDKLGVSAGCSVALLYRYTVDTMTYESGRIGWDAWSAALTLDVAEQFVRDHPPGRAITVHYDPDDPAIAMIDPTGARFGLAHANSAARALIWTFAACGVLALAYCAVA
jgi:hypothetical protein